MAPLKLESGRLQLVRMIEAHHPQGSPKNRVTIVFDGQPGMASPPVSESVKVIFTSDETADEKIKRMVQSSAQKQAVVVSDDRDLRYYVRALGASVMTVKEFVKRLRPGGRSEKPAVPPGKQISKTLEYEITSELEKLWLRKDTQSGNGSRP